MIKACIFDLDGTLADTLESMAVSTNKELKPLGYGPLPTENFRYYAGDGARMLVQRALTDAGDRKLVHLDSAYAAYSEIFSKDCTYKVTVFDGMRQTLETLKAMGMKLAVRLGRISEEEKMRLTEQMVKTCDNIRTLFGDGLFDWVQGQQEGIEKKPDPSGALAIAKVFGVNTEACMYIGDTNVDMQTGNRAGMFTVGVLWGFRTRQELMENHAHALAEKPEDLIRLCGCKTEKKDLK